MYNADSWRLSGEGRGYFGFCQKLSVLGDWRITGQEKYLDGAVLELREYFPPIAEWDHDHCVFCWSKFCQSNEPECLDEGYVTEDGKHWICSNCFKDFQDHFHFSLKQT